MYMEENEKLRIKSPLFLAQSETNCWNCGSEITVVALLAPNIINSEEDAVCKLLNITYLPEILLKRIQSLNQNFKLRQSKTTLESYYANVCQHCNKITGDFYLHSEPGGAFFPLEDEDFKKIRLIKFDLEDEIELESDYSYGFVEEMLEKGKMIK